MKNLFGRINILTENEMEFIHKKSLEILENTGMLICGEELRNVLAQKGAKVLGERVLFPTGLIEETLFVAKQNAPTINGGVNPKKSPFSWHTFDVPHTNEPMSSFGGACLNILDYSGTSRNATTKDMVEIVRVGEEIDQIASVGNPVICSLNDNGREIDERIKTIIGVSLLAKHSTKWGEAEVWTVRELNYILEICFLLCGGMENYKKTPFFISPKDPVTPLALQKEACEIFTALSKMGIACTVISVPIAGVTNTVNPVGSITMANAEILGTMAAILAINDKTPVCGGTISGVMNMKTTCVDYSAPEAILADMGLHCLHTKKYGINCGVGTGYFDGKNPGVQSGVDSTIKMLFSAMCGKASYPAGLVNGGKTFSPVQAMIDLDIAQNVATLMHSFEANEEALAFSDIIQKGIGGSFLDADSTLKDYKNNWIPQVFSRTGKENVEENAMEKWAETLKKAPETVVSDKTYKEIDNIVKRAKKELLNA